MQDYQKGILVLTIGLSSFFGAGIVDMVFTDVIPMRPYSAFFITGLALRKKHTQHKDYNANRSGTQYLEQINEPLEQYTKRKREAFKKKYGEKVQ